MHFTDDDKRRYAEALLHDPSDPHRAAFRLFEGDPVKALQIAEIAESQEIKNLQNELINGEDEGELAFIPSKAEYLRALWDNANNPMYPPDIREKYFKQFGEATKYLSKESQPVGTVNNTQNNIMVVPYYATDADWERELLANQEALIHDSQSS